MNLKKYVDIISETGVVLSLTGMVLSVAIQVFTRFFMDSAPHWTEEVSRIFFVFAIAFGAGLAIRDRSYVQLDYFMNKFSENTRAKIQFAINIVVLLFGALISVYALQFIQLGASETSPSLQINMSYIFSSMFIMGISIIYYSIVTIMDNSKQKDT